MNIWNILGIEPTTDKKAIRKAYAAKTREIHPEEKPEEFKRLHEAYQAALGYADYVRQVEQSGGSVTSFYKIGENVAENGLENTGDDEIEGAAGTAEDHGGNVSGGGDGKGTAAAGKEEPVDGNAGVADVPEETTADGSAGEADAPEEEPGRENLRAYFEESQERHEQQAAAFLDYWKEFRGPYHDQEAMTWWREYLYSEEFQSIRYHARVLKTLADEIDDKCFYGIDEVKMLFWEAYGFQEGEENVCQGDRQRLYRSLYPAYAKQQKNIQYEQKWAKNDKIIRVLVGIAVAALLVICGLIPVTIHRQRENGRQFLIDYMARQYPETVFSDPERTGKEDDGSIIYALHSSAHPELPVTAKVEYGYVEGERTYVVHEDYRQLLFEHYAARYGLEGGLVSYTEGVYANAQVREYSTLFYADVEGLDDFCKKAVAMFREQEELRTMAEVAVCTESVLFPQILLRGGVPEQPFADEQVYDLRNMEAEEFKEALREAYMCYMFQYESWNITTEQYREWGAAYEKRCGEWENDDGGWHEVFDSDTGELLCRLFIPTYDKWEGSYNINGVNMPLPTRMITLGNAYFFLQDRGADLTVNEDGSGFAVAFYGTVTDFGNEPAVKFYDLRDCY